jgi:hypothetical protein
MNLRHVYTIARLSWPNQIEAKKIPKETNHLYLGKWINYTQ